MKDRKVLVTGAGTGIGRGVALEFAREGASVALHYSHSGDGARSAVEEIERGGGKACALQADFRDAASARALPGRAAEFLGGLDVLVNNAGITMNQPFLETTIEQYDTLFNVNMRAMFFVTQGAAERMVEAGGGVVINIGSVHAYGAMVEHAVYAATKAAIVGFTRSLARELGPRNVTVNAVAPGYIQTPMTDKLSDDQRDALLKNIAIPRLGTPEDVAEAVAFLAGPGASYITGIVLNISGGLYI